MTGVVDRFPNYPELVGSFDRTTTRPTLKAGIGKEHADTFRHVQPLDEWLRKTVRSAGFRW